MSDRIVFTMPEVTGDGPGTLNVGFLLSGRPPLPCNADECSLDKAVFADVPVVFSPSP